MVSPGEAAEIASLKVSYPFPARVLVKFPVTCFGGDWGGLGSGLKKSKASHVAMITRKPTREMMRIWEGLDFAVELREESRVTTSLAHWGRFDGSFSRRASINSDNQVGRFLFKEETGW